MGHFKNNIELLKYFPGAYVEPERPEIFFSCIISAIWPAIINDFLNNAENRYWEKQKNTNQVFEIDPKIMEELSGIKFKQSLLQTKPGKKISLSKINFEE